MHNWEYIEQNHGTYRMRVPGGWIYKQSRDGHMVFVPYETFSQTIPYERTPPATCNAIH